MMGDFAQPLNCSDRITPQDPNGDKGGELFCLSMDRTADGKCSNNLRAFWDHVFEREFGDHGNVIEIAARLSPKYRDSCLSICCWVNI